MNRLPAIIALLFLVAPLSVSAASNHLLISQIQIGTVDSAGDEFVQLFNPTSESIDLTDFRLQSNTANLVSTLTGSLASGKYYLIARPSYLTIPITPDVVYSASTSAMTANSYITLYASDHTTIIDRVGMGTATQFESSPAATLEAGQSLLRTPSCEDTDNNSTDFAVNNSPTFKNSTSASEPCTTPTPTPMLTSTPTPTSVPTPTNTPLPTLTPTNTPMPTITPTVTPTVTLAPTPTPPPHSSAYLTCTVTYRAKTILGMTVYFPKISCHRAS